MDLLARLAGWRRTRGAGGIVLTGPPGRIAVEHEVRPIPRLRALLGAAGACERFATLEGEPAAIASAGERTVALVIGDDAATIVDGTGAVADLVRALAEHSFLGLGPVRRRRYFHRAPPGWTGLRYPHAARWLHPAYPRTAHALTVFDARPRAATAPEIVDRALADPAASLLLDPPEPLMPIAVAGLAGTVARIHGRPGEGAPYATIVRATLVDERFTYAVELTGPRDTVGDSASVLTSLLSTIEPIAQPRLADLGERVVFWSD